jgi:hypothetical protein
MVIVHIVMTLLAVMLYTAICGSSIIFAWKSLEYKEKNGDDGFTKRIMMRLYERVNDETTSNATLDLGWVILYIIAPLAGVSAILELIIDGLKWLTKKRTTKTNKL